MAASHVGASAPLVLLILDGRRCGGKMPPRQPAGRRRYIALRGANTPYDE